jgi:hypothetical protein
VRLRIKSVGATAMRGGRGVSKVVEVEKKERRFRVCGRNWEEFFRGRYLGQVKLAYHEQRTTSSFFWGQVPVNHGTVSAPLNVRGPWTVDLRGVGKQDVPLGESRLDYTQQTEL